MGIAHVLNGQAVVAHLFRDDLQEELAESIGQQRVSRGAG